MNQSLTMERQRSGHVLDSVTTEWTCAIVKTVRNGRVLYRVMTTEWTCAVPCDDDGMDKCCTV